MPNVLSIDVGKRSLGYVVFCTSAGTILSWGTAQLPLQRNSYLPAILEFEQVCNARAFSVVVIERQLRHLNFQAGRIEANLEALFTARDKQVYLTTLTACSFPSDSGEHLPQGRMQLLPGSRQRARLY